MYAIRSYYGQDTELLQLVTFSIGEEEFGVDILKVQEIIRTMEITKVPKAPEFVEGVINLRGKVIPIIDLRKRFGIVITSYSIHYTKLYDPPRGDGERAARGRLRPGPGRSLRPLGP